VGSSCQDDIICTLLIRKIEFPLYYRYICGSVVSNRANGFDSSKSETTKGVCVCVSEEFVSRTTVRLVVEI
jgi:hypothetical protein